MKTLKKILSVVVTISFLATNFTFAVENNCFKLSPPSKFMRFQGPEFKEAAQVVAGVRAALKELDIINLEGLRALGAREIIEDSIFRSKVKGEIFFSQAEEAEVSGRNIFAEHGGYLITASAGYGDYFCLISKSDNAQGFNVSITSSRIMQEALKEGVVKFTHESLSEEDRTTLETYLEHEISSDNSEAIDPFIKKKMVNGDYAVDTNTLTNNPLYQNASADAYDKLNLTQLLSGLEADLEALGLVNARNIIDVISSKPFVFIPYENESELPRITINGEKVPVTAHSSEFATYIFLKKNVYSEVIGDRQWSSPLNMQIAKELVHEVGARCGLMVTLEDGRIHNVLDEAYNRYVDADRPEGFELPADIVNTIRNIAPVNLLELELRNDYAAGVKEKKNIFTRAMALVLAVIIPFACEPAKKEPGLVPLTQQEIEALARETVQQAEQIPKAAPQESLRLTQDEKIEKLIKEMRMGDPKDDLWWMFTHDNPAKEDLVQMGIPAVPYLVKSLSSRDSGIRKFAAEALGKIGEREAVKPLTEALNDEYSWVRAAAATALGELGASEAVAPLIRSLKSIDLETYKAAAESLEKLGWQPENNQELIAYLIAKRDLHTIANLLTKDIKLFSEALKNEKWYQRRTIISVLGQLNNSQATKILVMALEDEDFRVSKMASEFLQRSDWQPANQQERITFMIASQDWDGLVSMGNVAIRPLVETLGHRYKVVRRGAADTLEKLDWNPKNQEERIRHLIAKQDWDAVIRIGAPAVNILIGQLLQDTYYEGRKDAAIALGRINNPKAVRPLMESLGTDVEWFSLEVAKALGEMWPASKEAVPALLEAIANGNAGACWIIDRDKSITKEAISLMAKSIIEEPSRASGFRREFFAKVAKDRFESLLDELTGEDRAFLLVLYLTSQSVPRGQLEGAIDIEVKDSRKQKEATELFSNADVVRNIDVLNSVAPETLKECVEAIRDVWLSYKGPGMTFDAAQDMCNLLEDIRLVELARRSTAVKLLVQEGDIVLPGHTYARFRWSGKPSVKIDIPPVSWNDQDIHNLRKMLRSKHAYYRRTAEKALRNIQVKSGLGEREDVSSLDRAPAMRSAGVVSPAALLVSQMVMGHVPETVIDKTTQEVVQTQEAIEKIQKAQEEAEKSGSGEREGKPGGNIALAMRSGADPVMIIGGLERDLDGVISRILSVTFFHKDERVAGFTIKAQGEHNLNYMPEVPKISFRGVPKKERREKVKAAAEKFKQAMLENRMRGLLFTFSDTKRTTIEGKMAEIKITTSVITDNQGNRSFARKNDIVINGRYVVAVEVSGSLEDNVTKTIESIEQNCTNNPMAKAVSEISFASTSEMLKDFIEKLVKAGAMEEVNAEDGRLTYRLLTKLIGEKNNVTRITFKAADGKLRIKATNSEVEFKAYVVKEGVPGGPVAVPLSFTLSADNIAAADALLTRMKKFAKAYDTRWPTVGFKKAIQAEFGQDIANNLIREFTIGPTTITGTDSREISKRKSSSRELEEDHEDMGSLDEEVVFPERAAMYELGRADKDLWLWNAEHDLLLDKMVDVLWLSGTRVISEKEARARLVSLAPRVSDETRNAWMELAASVVLTMGITRVGKHAKPEDLDIKAVAARIKELGIEVFIPSSEVPDSGDKKDVRQALENMFGDRVRYYNDLAHLQSINIESPEKAIVMIVGLGKSDLDMLDSMDDQIRFMNFEKANIKRMSTVEHENYIAETLSILLVARAITLEEAQNEYSLHYQMLAHLLEGHITEGELPKYIRRIADNNISLRQRLVYVIHNALKAVPAAAYKLIKPAVQVLWSA